jgi:signal transduction histidine kinase
MPEEAPLRLPSSVPIVASRPLRILVVSGEVEQLMPVWQMLKEDLQCDVTSVHSSAEALQSMIEHAGEVVDHDYDVVVVDSALSDMSGLELLTQLRIQGCSTPVIMVAPEGNESLAIEALRLGACDYIVKSGEYAKFFPQVVAQVVDRARIMRRNAYLETEHVRFARLAAIGEMAAGIAHEIRNPMTVILGMATVIRDNCADLSSEELHRCAHAIADNCSHLNKILDEVLLSAQTTGQREAVSLSDLVDETLSFMRFDPVFRRCVQVRRDFHSDGLIQGNRDQLKQVFINLFRNAAQSIQMADKPRGVLEVAINEEPLEHQATVRVLDEGVGIPDEVLPRIFESGFSTKQRNGEVGGSGLGLNICRRIIEDHGGHIWAESRESGTGAMFCLSFPLSDETQ